MNEYIYGVYKLADELECIKHFMNLNERTEWFDTKWAAEKAAMIMAEEENEIVCVMKYYRDDCDECAWDFAEEFDPESMDDDGYFYFDDPDTVHYQF